MISHKLAWVFSIGTFVFGVSADSCLNLQGPLPTIEVDTSYRPPDPNITLNGRIQIELASVSILAGTKREATFKVTNRTGEPIRYAGLGEDHSIEVWIRENGRIRYAWYVDCLGAAGDQFTIEPRRYNFISVPIPPKGGIFDVGFDFRTGSNDQTTTVWFLFPEFPLRYRKA